MLFQNINANIRLQILADHNKGINKYEVRAKAVATLLTDDPCMTELEAHKLANAWYECLTYADLPALSLMNA